MIENNLSKILREKEMSQKKLSDLTGIRRQTINDIYHKINISIKMEHLDKICSVLECEIDDIFKYVSNKKSPKKFDK